MNLEATVDEAVAIIRRYGAAHVFGDQYSAGWVRQAFARRGILYVAAPEKAIAYANLEPRSWRGRPPGPASIRGGIVPAAPPAPAPSLSPSP